jgi:hypothetical protein
MGRTAKQENTDLDELILREINSLARCTRENSLPRLKSQLLKIKSEERFMDDGMWAYIRGRLSSSPKFKDPDLGRRTTVSVRQEVLFEWRVRPIRADSKQARAYIPATALQNRKQRRAVARAQAKEANAQFAGRFAQAPLTPADFRAKMLEVAEETDQYIDAVLPAQNGSKP